MKRFFGMGRAQIARDAENAKCILFEGKNPGWGDAPRWFRFSAEDDGVFVCKQRPGDGTDAAKLTYDEARKLGEWLIMMTTEIV